jgi:hypothetical protein
MTTMFVLKYVHKSQDMLCTENKLLISLEKNSGQFTYVQLDYISLWRYNDNEITDQRVPLLCTLWAGKT